MQPYSGKLNAIATIPGRYRFTWELTKGGMRWLSASKKKKLAEIGNWP